MAIRKFQSEPTTISLTTSTARSTLLPPGRYEITCATDFQFLQGDSAVDATTSSNLYFGGERLEVAVSDATDGYIAGIHASTDTAYISRIS